MSTKLTESEKNRNRLNRTLDRASKAAPVIGTRCGFVSCTDCPICLDTESGVGRAYKGGGRYICLVNLIDDLKIQRVERCTVKNNLKSHFEPLGVIG